MADSFVETTNKTLELPGKAQKRFELGVCMAVYGWNELTTAVENEWGGADSADKRDWLIGTVIDLFKEGNVMDAATIEDRLLDIMDVEFGVGLEDDSAWEVGKLVINLYKQCFAQDFSTVDAMYARYQEKEKNKASQTQTPLVVDETGAPASDDDDEDEDGDVSEESNVEMMDVEPSEPSEPSGPIIDEDGFELVQKKGKGRRR